MARHLGTASARRGERGYNLVVLVVIITIMNIVLAAVLPLWSQAIRRNKEEELVFRGLQYAEAIRVFHNRFQRWPTRLEELVEVKPRSIRQLWKDPMTEDGKWQLIFEGREQLPFVDPTGSSGLPPPRTGAINKPGTAGLDQQGQSFGPIKGVYSRSTKKSILLWGGHDEYDQWRFNADLLSGGGVITSGPKGGAGVPNGRGQSLLSVRWVGRPWRTLGGGLATPPGGIGEPVIRPGGFGTGSATPGAPGVQRNPQPTPPPTPNGRPRF